MRPIQTILITGNMGYIGPTVVKHLRRHYPQAQLIGVDLGFFAHCLTGAGTLPEHRVDVQYYADVRTLEPHILAGVDAIVHLAAISNDPMGKAYEDVTEQVNYRASVRLAQQAQQAGVARFVFASSCSVYGYAEGAARDESSELNPLTAYARSKINTEQAITGFANDDFTITSLRFPTACGMSERLRLDLVLNDFVAAAVATNRIQILSDGTPWRPLIDIKDMARAMHWAIARPADPAFLAINVGRTAWNYQVKTLAETVKEAMPAIEIDINTEAAPDKRSYRVDFGQFEGLAPDYLPQIDLAQSIGELKAGLETMRFKDTDFRDSDLIRLKVLGRFRDSGLLNEWLEWTDRQQ